MSSPQPPSPRDRPVVLRFDGTGRLRGFTAAARRVFGLDAGALGTPLAEFVAARLDPALAATVTAARDGDAAGGPLVDRCGRHWWYALAAEETGAGGGGLVLTLAAAEASPPPSFTAVMDRAELPAAIVDAAGAVRWANPALAARLGAAPAALVGTDWFERCVPPECRADAEHAVARALAADGPAGDGARAVAFRLGGGVDEPCAAAWHAVGFPSGTAGAVALVGHELAAGAIDAPGADALAGVGHELRQPLQTLRFVHGVLARTVRDPDGRKVVDALADALTATARTVDRLVEGARPAPPRIAPRLAAVDLGELLAGLGARFADAAAAKGLELAVVATSARARSDPTVLQSVVDDLVAAAIRQTESGRVLVGCRRRGGEVVVEVADSRATAPLAEVAAVCGDGGGDTPEAGLARRLEALPDHRLEVGFVLGGGARFALHLPVADAPAAPPRPPPPPGEVVVVADDAAEREVLARLLALEGYPVVAAADVAAALARLDACVPPRLAVVDRPAAPAAEAALLERRLRARAGAPVAVVVLADAAPPEAVAGGDGGGLHFLAKPTDAAALLALLAELTVTATSPARAPPAPGEAGEPGERPVAVVAAEPAAREHAVALLRGAGHAAVGYADTAALLAAGGAADVACVLLDLDGRGGVGEVTALTGGGATGPVIVRHAGDDVAVAVAAMRAGAFDFLAEPVDDDALLEAVRAALREGERREHHLEATVATRHRFERLTGREREVLRLVVAGRSNKEVAQALGISPRTVENHRAHIMEKTGIHSLAELVAAARNAGVAA
jgi:two-component system CheB/CheR fusion protein